MAQCCKFILHSLQTIIDTFSWSLAKPRDVWNNRVEALLSVYFVNRSAVSTATICSSSLCTINVFNMFVPVRCRRAATPIARAPTARTVTVAATAKSNMVCGLPSWQVPPVYNTFFGLWTSAFFHDMQQCFVISPFVSLLSWYAAMPSNIFLYQKYSRWLLRTRSCCKYTAVRRGAEGHPESILTPYSPFAMPPQFVGKGLICCAFLIPPPSPYRGSQRCTICDMICIR